MTAASGRLRIAVLTCSSLGLESAALLSRDPMLEVVAILRAPPRRPRTLLGRLRRAHRERGAGGVIAELTRRALGVRPPSVAGTTSPSVSVPLIEIDDFSSTEGLATLRQLNCDLAVVDGTYILKPPVFLVPRLGAINIHCGYLPKYRGAPPVFWELYNGESTVGVSIHRVVAEVDRGAILSRDLMALVPPERGADVLEYCRGVWKAQLRPAALRLLAEVAHAHAIGVVHEIPQAAYGGTTYRTPTAEQVRELEHRLKTASS